MHPKFTDPKNPYTCQGHTTPKQQTVATDKSDASSPPPWQAHQYAAPCDCCNAPIGQPCKPGCPTQTPWPMER